MKNLLLAGAFILFYGYSQSQTLNDYGLEYWPEVPVYSIHELNNPWAGGINNVQFGEIDLNFDGFNDLLLFEKHGNKLLPYIFQNGSSAYKFDPSYRRFFPKMQHMMQLRDFDNNGLPDIFTYTIGGIMVYKNVSQQQLAFEQAVNQFLTSLQGNIFTNILVTNVDYPSIYDLDGDSDLDILTFWGLGSFVELHQNMSVETYGIPDSLLFHKVDFCWGNFAESDESNIIYLDTCIDISSQQRSFNIDDVFSIESKDMQHDRHTGSTLNVMDINNDQIPDLMLGDVDFSNIKALINSGSGLDAFMTQVIDSFPSGSPVNLPSFPSMQQLDAYNDGVRDLVISPFEPSLVKSAGKNSVWLYNINPDGELIKVTESFLQDEMIDRGLGAFPVLRDINGDNLVDLVIGNYGLLDSCFIDFNGILRCIYTSSLAYYQNTGTQNSPVFTLRDNDLAGLSSLKKLSLNADFTDLNNDELPDMVIGAADGQLTIYYNTGNDNGIPNFGEPFNINSVNAGEYLSPTIEDIDSDGLYDILVGNKNGTLCLFRNNGTPQNPNFVLVTLNYGQVNVTDPSQSYTGYSTPKLFRNNESLLSLLVGSESGKIFYYPDLNEDYNAKIISKDDAFIAINEGIRTSITVGNINSDSYPEFIVGNYTGGLTLYKGIKPQPEGFAEKMNFPEIGIHPNPASSKIVVELPLQTQWRIKIYDLYGRIIMAGSIIGNEFEYEIKNMGSGLFIIVASHDNILLTGKLIIQ